MKGNMRPILLTAIAFAGALVLSGALGTLPAVAASGTGDVSLPPDPGEAGKGTLAGIDSDGDGLRDDIQRYIALTFPDSARVRAAFTQYAQKIQETVLLGEDRVGAVNLAAELGHARNCISYLIGGTTGDELRSARRSTFSLRAEVLNTRDRTRAYRRYDAQLAGGVFKVLPESEWKKGCAFDPDALPN